MGNRADLALSADERSGVIDLPPEVDGAGIGSRIISQVGGKPPLPNLRNYSVTGFWSARLMRKMAGKAGHGGDPNIF